jgi:hypothetical protein
VAPNAPAIANCNNCIINTPGVGAVPYPTVGTPFPPY